MKKLLSLLLCAAMLCALALPALADGAGEGTSYVEEGRWYTAAAKNVIEKGIMTGTDHGFAAEELVTRAMVVQTLYNLDGKPEVFNTVSTFPDVQGKWFEAAVRWAERVGVTQGGGNGRFNGDANITRGELVVFLCRYAAYKGLDVTGDANLLTYADGELVAGWAIPSFQWAVTNKVVQGGNDNCLGATSVAIRAELAQILSNYVALFP